MVSENVAEEAAEEAAVVDKQRSNENENNVSDTSNTTAIDYRAAFIQLFKKSYGFNLEGKSIVIDDFRVQGIGKSTILEAQDIAQCSSKKECNSPPQEKQCARMYLDTKKTFCNNIPIYLLSKLKAGHRIIGPSIIINSTSTCVLEEESEAIITPKGDIEIIIHELKKAFNDKGTVVAKDSHLRTSVEKHQCDPITLAVFQNRFMSIAAQCGKMLQRTSVSVNIKERLDFSCAIFDEKGNLVANAPHVPVHLGAMSKTVKMQIALPRKEKIANKDVLITNDPQFGGSHLPDITVITPVFIAGNIAFYVASRGHHADIGGSSPGSMPSDSRSLKEEGTLIHSDFLVKKGVFNEKLMRKRMMQDEGCVLVGIGQVANSTKKEKLVEDKLITTKVQLFGSRNLEDTISDLKAQVAANNKGAELIKEFCCEHTLKKVQAYMGFVQDNGEAAVNSFLKSFVHQHHGRTTYEAADFMDDGTKIKLKISITSAITPSGGQSYNAAFDFTGTGPNVLGNWNAPSAITTAACLYSLRCMIDESVYGDIPLNSGCLRPIKIKLPPGCLLNPTPSLAICGGNVLTSQRIIDVILKCFNVVAASQGCMNNFTFGNQNFGYYETIAGGSGAGPTWHGTSGVQCHATNTRMSDVEILEANYPVLVRKFLLREHSGGKGQYQGGNGVIREVQFLDRNNPIIVSLLCERRSYSPYGVKGGQPGKKGKNLLWRFDSSQAFHHDLLQLHVGKNLVLNNDNSHYIPFMLGGKSKVKCYFGDIIQILTPGGGGWGKEKTVF